MDPNEPVHHWLQILRLILGETKEAPDKSRREEIINALRITVRVAKRAEWSAEQLVMAVKEIAGEAGWEPAPNGAWDKPLGVNRFDLDIDLVGVALTYFVTDSPE